MTPPQEQDEAMMRRCLTLAHGGLGWVSPNPLVGCVIIKDGRVIGEGFHREVGQPHAEVEALRACTTDPRGAALYVNLEPCMHYGRTPPCTEAIIKAGIREVVIGLRDPNPVAAGGSTQLQAAGIRVRTGVCEAECRELNHGFLHWVTTHRPYVAAKVAISSDYKIAAAPGVRTRITGDEAQTKTHELRQRYDAILVGVGTVLADNPHLGVHAYPHRPRDPKRIILDSTLRLPADAMVLRDPNVLVVTTKNADPTRRAALEAAGIPLLITHSQAGQVDLQATLDWCTENQVTSILVEGGRSVFDRMVAERRLHRWYIFQSPKHLGDRGMDALADLAPLRDCIHRGTPLHYGADALYVCELNTK